MALAAAAYLHLRSINISDPDGFYHIQHAALYRARGLCMTAFPWIPKSIISVQAADIWYGFHLILVPFTWIADPALRIKVPGIALTWGMLLALGGAAVRLRLAKPYLWPFVVLCSAPNILYHLTMTRPHVISMGLCALLFAFLIEGSALAVLGLCAALTFLHLTFFWTIPLIVVPVLILRALPGEPFQWRHAAAAIGGIAAGWLARPHALGAARIVRVQLFELMFEKQSGAPLTFAKELFPISGQVVAENFIPFLILWVGAIGVAAAWVGRRRHHGLIGESAARNASESSRASAQPETTDSSRSPTPGPPSLEVSDHESLRHSPPGLPSHEVPDHDASRFAAHRLLLLSSFCLSAGFFGMTVFVARRSFDPWAVFATIFIAAVYTAWRAEADPSRARPGRRTDLSSRAPDTESEPPHVAVSAPARPSPFALDSTAPFRVGTAVGVAVLLVMSGWSVWRSARSMEVATPPTEYQEAGEWLAAHSREGDIVYNVYWDTFAKLFYWDTTNRYVSGMDPIFEYAFDRSLYWKSHYLQTGQATRLACGNAACTSDAQVDTFTAMRRDFGATWLLVEKDRSPKLYRYVSSDVRFVPAFENAKHAVYRLDVM